MSKELRTAGLEAKFEAILEQAEELSELDFQERAHEHLALEGTIRSYQSAREGFIEITGLTKYLDSVVLSSEPGYRGYPDQGTGIQQVIANSRSAVAYLGRGREQVPTEVEDKLNSLTKAISIISEVEPDLHVHLVTAIGEHEKTHYLAATVLSAKTIDYVLNKLEGTDEQAKADILVKKGLLEKELKDGFVRTLKKARNYYVHDMRAAPPSGESLSILTTACQLAEIYVQAQ